MTSLVSNYQEELARFLLTHLQSNLSGTSVLSQDDVIDTLESVNFVIAHSLQGKCTKEKFESGKKEIQKQMKQLKEEISEIRNLAIFRESQSYQKTYEEFNVFFETYDLDRKAHETGNAWFDYQLAHPIDDQQLKGIDFVKNYFDCLKKEAQFISQIPAPIIHEILSAYDKKILVDYRIDVNNLYEVVFNQIIAKVLIDKTVTTTALLSKEEKRYLLNQKKLELPLNFKQLIDTDKYYQNSFSKFKKKLLMEKGSYLLSHVNSNQQEIIFTEPMSEKEFLLVVKKSNELEGKKKIEWLATTIQSPYDLVEINQVEYFTSSEWQLLYQQLSDRLLFQYILLIKQQSNEEITSFLDLLNYDEEELTAFKQYLHQIPSHKKKELDDILTNIDVTKQQLD